MNIYIYIYIYKVRLTLQSRLFWAYIIYIDRYIDI